ncbi:MAG TPA: ATP-binding cassette domain-containing protein [Acidimicrobiales bacterium]
MAALQLDDLTVRAAPTGAGFQVSVEAAAGEVVGVAVPSAAVGRTIARTVAGLAAPLSGRVLAGGRDVTDVPAPDRGIGYVPAGGGLFPHLTLAANITYRLDPDEHVGRLVDAHVTEVTTRLDLVGVQGRLPHAVTADQRLRAAIARAVLRSPTALVIDLPEADAAALRAQPVLDPVTLPAGDDLAVVVCTDDATLLGRLDRFAPATPARQPHAAP